MWKYLAQKFPDVCSYSDEARSYYEHLCAFHISFRFGDRKRTIQEYHPMSEANQKRFRLKYWVAHSALLSATWRWLKKKISNRF